MRHFCVGGWPDKATESVSIWRYKMLPTSLSLVILQIAVLIKTKSKSSIGQPCHTLAAALSFCADKLFKMKGVIRIRDEEILTLTENLCAQIIENENTRASLEEWRDSRGQNGKEVEEGDHPA